MAKLRALANVSSAQGANCCVFSAFGASVASLLEDGDIDGAIVSNATGYSPLGAEGRYLAEQLGCTRNDLIDLGYATAETSSVSLVGIQNKKNTRFKGLILAPGNNCTSYQPFVTSVLYSKPYRDFYYNVAYESIAFACLRLGARRIAISHLSSSGTFKNEMAICQVEALRHFCKEHPNHTPTHLIYYGCCMESSHFSDLWLLDDEEGMTTHRPIRTVERTEGIATWLTLNWQRTMKPQNP